MLVASALKYGRFIWFSCLTLDINFYLTWNLDRAHPPHSSPGDFTLFFRASIYLTGCKTKSRRAIFPCPFFFAGSLPPRVSTARYWPDDFLPTRRFPRYNFVIHDSFASILTEINVASRVAPRVLERQRLLSIKRSAPFDRALNCYRRPISISSLIDRLIPPVGNFRTVLFHCAKVIPSFQCFKSIDSGSIPSSLTVL